MTFRRANRKWTARHSLHVDTRRRDTLFPHPLLNLSVQLTEKLPRVHADLSRVHISKRGADCRHVVVIAGDVAALQPPFVEQVFRTSVRLRIMQMFSQILM